MNIQELEPSEIMMRFKELSDIPRGSGNERAVSDWIAAFARARGLDVLQDEVLNLLIRKPGSPGHGSAPTLILHGHMDMVCERAEGSSHDFLCDPIAMVVDDEFISADGTSLGADNGVGVAYILAILASDELAHPPLEVVLTVMEEKGKVGAANFDAAQLKGRRMVDFNWCNEGVILAGCSGDLTLTVDFPSDTEEAPADYVAKKVAVTGLLGGHCEFDIAQERANAIVALGRILVLVREAMDLRLVGIDGGVQNSAIPSEASATVLIPRQRYGEFDELVKSVTQTLVAEFAVADPNLKVTLTPQLTAEQSSPVGRCQSTATTNAVLDFCILVPNGVLSWSRSVEGLVESANNLGTLRTEPEGFRFMTTITAAVTSRKHDVARRITLLASRLSGHAEWFGLDAPEFPYNADSRLLDAARGAFADSMGYEAETLVSNCSLELGMFIKKLPGLDTISIGTEMSGMHSAAERVSHTSIARVWTFTRLLMKRLAEA